MHVCVNVSVLQYMILNKLKYKLDHKRELFCIEIEDKVTLTIIVQTSVKRSCLFLHTHLNNFYFHYIDTF
jgi:uncharacterized protein (UPF0248 family)